MHEPIVQLRSLSGWRFAGALVCVGVAGCGSSGSTHNLGVGASDHPGGSSGQSGGGTSAGSGGRQQSGAGGSGGGGAGTSGTGNGGSGAVSGTAGSTGSGVELGYCPGEMPRSGYAPCATGVRNLPRQQLRKSSRHLCAATTAVKRLRVRHAQNP